VEEGPHCSELVGNSQLITAILYAWHLSKHSRLLPTAREQDGICELRPKFPKLALRSRLRYRRRLRSHLCLTLSLGPRNGHFAHLFRAQGLELRLTFGFLGGFVSGLYTVAQYQRDANDDASTLTLSSPFSKPVYWMCRWIQS
jgi:hypothetical protein